MSVPYITAEMVEAKLDWCAVADAIEAGHKQPRADLGDVINRRDGDTLLTRAAWIDGLGMGVKSMSVFPNNKDVPTINGAMLVFDDQSGTIKAVIEGTLVTKWKTAADSVLGARMLARADARRLLIVGAGTVAGNLIEAYRSVLGDLEISVWNRTPDRAALLARTYPKVSTVTDLADAVAGADMIACATMSVEPILQGNWLRPGQHVDLIGAFRPDMREVDDEAMRRASVFVDSRDTTFGHIGELKIPLETGVISEADVKGDLYDLSAGRAGRCSDDEITLFKNGGGAHLDLMTAGVILQAWEAGQAA